MLFDFLLYLALSDRYIVKFELHFPGLFLYWI
jgi:hypothetical protein